MTKVRLQPRTGRRHQLRLHCLCLGHPIVGDYTYNILHREGVEQEQRQEEGEGAKEGEEVLSADRMMLHAYKLM